MSEGQVESGSGGLSREGHLVAAHEAGKEGVCGGVGKVWGIREIGIYYAIYDSTREGNRPFDSFSIHLAVRIGAM